MASLVLDVLRKGIWSSFCGGWYYDPNSATFTNTVHLYLFLFLLCFPFSIYIYLPRNRLNWLVYTFVVGCIFLLIKIINIGLHRMFDSSECIFEERLQVDGQLDCDKRKSIQKNETQEEEGIELQVFNHDKEYEVHQNESILSFDSVEFADFNSAGGKEEMLAAISGTIDLKVDVHRKNSSDSSEETCTKNNQKLLIIESNKQKSNEEKISGLEMRPNVTNSEEVIIESNLHMINNKKNKNDLNKNISQDISIAGNSREENGNRLSERTRQYSVSVTLGEENEPNNTLTDPTPARSMQLNSDFEADTNKNPGNAGLLYWKEKWDKTKSANCPRTNAMFVADNPGSSIGSGIPRRSSSPLTICASNIVRPIIEHNEQSNLHLRHSSIQKSNDSDEYEHRYKDENHDFQIRHGDDDDDTYGDTEDLDVELDIELDASYSPLLTDKHGATVENLESYNISSFSRKTCYIDSLTKKQKLNLKNKQIHLCTSPLTQEEEGYEQDICINSDTKIDTEKENANDNLKTEAFSDDDDQVSAMFDWLFSISDTTSNLNDHTFLTKEKFSIKMEQSETKLKQLDQLKNTFQDVFGGTCSQFEIGFLSSQYKSSLSEPVNDIYITTNENSKIEQNSSQMTESTEVSPSGSNNELISLLPVAVTNSTNSSNLVIPCHSHRNTVRYDGKSTCNRHWRQSQRCRSNSREVFPLVPSPRINLNREIPNEFSNFIKDLCRSQVINVESIDNTHIAASHDDTTEGAVHIFQDENGQWMSYTFDERGNGVAVNVGTSISQRKEAMSNVTEDHQKNVTCPNLRIDNCTTFVNSNLRQGVVETASNSTQPVVGYNISQRTSEQTTHSQLYQIRENDNGTYCFETVENPSLFNIQFNQTFGNGIHSTHHFNRLARLHMVGPSNSQSELNLEYGSSQRTFDCLSDRTVPIEKEKEKRRYYKFKIFPFSHFKIYFDRLSLDSLLDYNETYFETLLCIVLALLVSLLGAVMLHLHYYHDIPAFIFCFVIATSHYSLLKSVQPDASSPVHGFNKVVAYSRPIYFIFCCSLIIGLDFLLRADLKWITLKTYNFNYNIYRLVRVMHDFLCTFILFFPILFTLGMFPQINTFFMYIFEQLDMHIFGGSAVTSLKAALYCIFRSVVAVLLLFGFAYGGLNEPKSSQHILFSIFLSLLVVFAYHLSRCACDPTHLWNILMKHFWPIEELNNPPMEPKKNEFVKKTNKSKKNKKKIISVCSKDNLKNDHNFEANVNSTAKNYVDESFLKTKKIGILEDENGTLDDVFPVYLQKTVNARLQSDLIISCISGIFIFLIHRSTVFSALQPELNPIMWRTACSLGFLLHYIMPQLRKQLPWLCIARPVLRSLEHEQFEAQAPAAVTWFEKIYIYAGFIEKNIIYPVMFIGCLTKEAPLLKQTLGPLASSLILTICSLKCLRLSFSQTSSQYLILAFSVLFFELEYFSENFFIIDYFVISIFYFKIYDLLLKMQFVLTYIAPWQISWGSAFHAFAQPFSLPHSAMMFAQAVLSAILSSPLYPFLGSAIFLTSYPRPIKFWERDYNTRRVDHSNTKMASHLERNLGADDNNLNSIFYEHLTHSLQRSLCGDLLMGRWGEISAGDCYILASDYLNCLIHIVELGNGLVTFQMRGLEFRGTYCQQREVEAIRDGVEGNDGCCCCKPGHLPFMLSLNAAFNQRWLAWEVTTGKYILEGYSISDNSAASMLQVFDFRKMLISYYVKSIIYYTVSNPKLEEWINSSFICEALQPLKDKNFVDLDPVFNMNIDEDYDYRYCGITRNSFCGIYINWIRYCNSRRENPIPDINKDSPLITLCFALSLLGRRTLGTASHNTAASVEFFLYGVHTLFKGDFRIASVRDEWVFTDMELLRKVVAPAIRMSLKLHQDHFMAPDEYECSPALFAAIFSHQENLVISHEGDPIWRKAVLSGMPSLLALRRVMDEGTDDYKIIMLNKRYLSFRVIKMNRECVRGLWAGQQQELIYLRNLNPERGSIQNAKQALRNIINSSCDQPIGYPIFVSPLTTSYAETNAQYSYYLGGPISIKSIKNSLFNMCRRIRKHFIEGCSSGSSAHSQDDGGFGHDGVYSMTTFNVHSGFGSSTIGNHQTIETSLTGNGGTITRVSTGSGISNRTSVSSAGPSKPGLVTLAGLLSPPGNTISDSFKLSERKIAEKDDEEREPVLYRVKIIDPGLVHDGINQGRLIDVTWPDEVMRQRGGRNFWKDWVPEVGMEGQVVHCWIPNHPNPNKRSTFDRTILLVKIDDKYVPISENGVQDLGAEV